MGNSTISFKCTKCGSKDFLLPHSGQLQDQDVITCAGCKGAIEYGVARQQMKGAVQDLLSDALGGMFKKR